MLRSIKYRGTVAWQVHATSSVGKMKVLGTRVSDVYRDFRIVLILFNMPKFVES